MSKLNPNASAFTFNPNATSWTVNQSESPTTQPNVMANNTAYGHINSPVPAVMPPLSGVWARQPASEQQQAHALTSFNYRSAVSGIPSYSHTASTNMKFANSNAALVNSSLAARSVVNATNSPIVDGGMNLQYSSLMMMPNEYETPGSNTIAHYGTAHPNGVELNFPSPHQHSSIPESQMMRNVSSHRGASPTGTAVSCHSPIQANHLLSNTLESSNSSSPLSFHVPQISSPLSEISSKDQHESRKLSSPTASIHSHLDSTPNRSPITSPHSQQSAHDAELTRSSSVSSLQSAPDFNRIIYTTERIMLLKEMFKEVPVELIANSDLPVRGTPHYESLMTTPIRQSSDTPSGTPTPRQRVNSRRMRQSFQSSPRRSPSVGSFVASRSSTSDAAGAEPETSNSNEQNAEAISSDTAPRDSPQRAASNVWKGSTVQSLKSKAADETEVPMSPSKHGLGHKGLSRAKERNRGILNMHLKSWPRQPTSDEQTNAKSSSDSKNVKTVLDQLSRRTVKPGVNQNQSGLRQSNNYGHNQTGAQGRPVNSKFETPHGGFDNRTGRNTFDNSSRNNRNIQQQSNTRPQRDYDGGSWRKAPVERPKQAPKSDDQQAASEMLAILNKLTPETFDKLTEKAESIAIPNVRALEAVCDRMFAKAVLEASFASMYAQFFSRLALKLPSFYDSKGDPVNLRTLLITKCHQRLVAEPDLDALNELGKEEKAEKKMKMKEQELGNVVLMGELFKNGLLSEHVIHACVNLMLNDESDGVLPSENIECLVTFIRTIGKLVDHTSIRLMDSYFSRISALSKSTKLAPRMRFMLQDLIELRKDKWKPRRAKIINPQTLDDIRKQKEEEKNSTRKGQMIHGRDRDRCWERLHSSKDRSSSRHGNKSNSAWGDTARKPLALTKREINPSTLASASRAKQRTNIDLDAPSSSYLDATLSAKKNRPMSSPVLTRKIDVLVREFFACKDIDEACSCIDDLEVDAHARTFERLLTMSFDMKEGERVQATNLMVEFIKRNRFNRQDVNQGLSNLLQKLDDVAIDVPKAPLHLAESLSLLAQSKLYSIAELIDIISKDSGDSRCTHKVALTMLSNIVSEQGKESLQSAWTSVNSKKFRLLFPDQMQANLQQHLDNADLGFLQT